MEQINVYLWFDNCYNCDNCNSIQPPLSQLLNSFSISIFITVIKQLDPVSSSLISNLIFRRWPQALRMFLQLKDTRRTISTSLTAGPVWCMWCVWAYHTWCMCLSVYACLSWSCEALDWSHQLPSLTIIYRASSSASVLLCSLRTERNNKWINLFSICESGEKNKHCLIALDGPVGLLA